MDLAQREMNKQHPWENKSNFNQAHENDDDDEQIEKTLNFFDSILDQYLIDADIKEENHRPKNHLNTSSSSRYIPAPRPRFDQTPNVRRYTSENNLNQIIIPTSSSKFKPSHARSLRTTATSTENLTSISSPRTPSNETKKSHSLLSNIASASLIDLSTIDKVSSRPRFRFVPPSNTNDTLTEEPEFEHEFHLKTIPTHQLSRENLSTKSSHQIVKPIVMIPAVVKSAPMSRLIETNIHHQNGNSAFKPHRSSKTGVSARIEQIKRNESAQQDNLQMGRSHSDKNPQFHQSMVTLSSPESIHTNRFAPPTTNGYHPSRSDPVLRRIQQVNNTSSINGLVHSQNRPQQQTYPYGSYISTNNGIPPSMNNNRPPSYYHSSKYHPAQSVYLPSPPVARTGGFPSPLSSSSNIYHFNQNHSPRIDPPKRQSHHQYATITTYL